MRGFKLNKRSREMQEFNHNNKHQGNHHQDIVGRKYQESPKILWDIRLNKLLKLV